MVVNTADPADVPICPKPRPVGPRPTQPRPPGSRLRGVDAGPSGCSARKREATRRKSSTMAAQMNLGPIERYLHVMWERNASDLLLTAHNKPLVRIDGQLMPIEDE